MSDASNDKSGNQSPPVQYVNTSQSKNKNITNATLSHILAPFIGFIIPVIFYAIYDEDDELIKSHLRESLNASLTFFIAAIIHGFLMMICIGILTFFVHWALYIVWAINANNALKAGEEYQYPFTIRFVS
mgnify:CR=1 FL=1|tara:strand:- start:3323 stop:3712 length:390 start_codon:yes stop_codon:yes gene_type:complete